MVKNSVTRINNLSRSVQTRPKPDNPAKPPDDNPIPARFSSFRLNSRFRRRFFFRFRSSFRQEFSSFRREFPVSGENSRFRHAFSSDFDPVIGKNFPVSSENFQFPARISRFRQRFFFRFRSSFRQEFSSFRLEFPVSGENFQFPARIPDSGDAFSSDFDAFLIPATDRTRPTLTITENRTNHFSGGRFRVTPPLHPTPAGRVRVGSITDPARPVDSPKPIIRLVI